MKCKKPWLFPDGTPKTEKEIKEFCKDWSPSVWEDYLKTLEVDQEEVLLNNLLLWRASEDNLYLKKIIFFKNKKIIAKIFFKKCKNFISPRNRGLGGLINEISLF